MPPNLSPLYTKYQTIKAEYPDVLILLRAGDSYVAFGSDVGPVALARGDGFTTGYLDNGDDEAVSYCRIPAQGCDAVIARLIRRGYRVGVDEGEE
jgi:DNA mismatch repair protein MutS